VNEEASRDPVDRVYQELGAGVFNAPDIGVALAGRDPDERAFLALVMCGAEIDNGGFEQLFGNSSDRISQHGAEGAERFGLSKHAAIIRGAWDRWCESNPGERDELDPRLSQLDEEWDSVDEELQRRLLKFAREVSP
jgi:hypothetical protein